MIVKPASPKAFQPMKAQPHFRADDIERDQKPMSTLKGVGAAYVRSWGGREGSR